MALRRAESKVGVDLGGGNVGVAKQKLHTAQIGAVLHHVRGATVPQAVRAGGVIGRLDQMPDPLARQRHSAQGKEETRGIVAVAVEANPGGA